MPKPPNERVSESTIFDAKLGIDQLRVRIRPDRGRKRLRATEVIVKFRCNQVLLIVSVIFSSQIFRSGGNAPLMAYGGVDV
jgi:hypothetical protein